MYPWTTLSDLEQAKRCLRGRIAVRRGSNATLAWQVLAPLRWFDTASQLWRQVAVLARLAAVPAAVAAARAVFPSSRWLRWIHLVVSLLPRGRQARETEGTTPGAEPV